MVRAIAFTLASTTLLLATGCSFLPFEAMPRTRVANPRADLHEVILVGFDGRPANTDPAIWETSLREQLLDVRGIDRIEIPTHADDPLLIPAPGRAFIGLTVLQFDPYYPPEVVVEVSLDVPSAPRRASADILELDRQGREHMVSARGAASQHRFQLRIDADDSRIGSDLVRFARSQLDGDRGLEPIDRVLRDSGRFVDFASWLILKESFRRLAEIQEGTP